MNHFHLKNLRLSQKILVTFFLLFMGFAYGVALFNAYEKTKLNIEGVVEHYQGNEAHLTYPMTVGQLVDITHPHAFMQPLIFFVLGLIFSGSSVRERTKILFYLLAFFGVALDLALPWIIRYGPTSLSLLHTLPGLLFSVSFAAFILIPLYEMWSPTQKH